MAIFLGDHEGDYQRRRFAQGPLPLDIRQADEDFDPVRRKVSGSGDALKEGHPRPS